MPGACNFKVLLNIDNRYRLVHVHLTFVQKGLAAVEFLNHSFANKNENFNDISVPCVIIKGVLLGIREQSSTILLCHNGVR